MEREFDMENVGYFEAHYYLGRPEHQINAVVRNKCEAELLAVLNETATLLGIDASLLAEAYEEGGFRDFWKVISDNAPALTILVLVAQLVVTAVPLFEGDNDDLEGELTRLRIEEKKLQIEKLKREFQESENRSEIIEKASKVVGSSLKVIKRRSNFYTHLEKYHEVTKIGFTSHSAARVPLEEERQVPRDEFRNFILSTNKLKSETDEEAVVEIVSPVLKEGRYKWKGVYLDEVISFEMQDSNFRDAVLLENIPFQHGTLIVCVLVINRELDEFGEIRITGYAVTTVIEKIDGVLIYQTPQGKKYKHAKKQAESQGELFNDGSNN